MAQAITPNSDGSRSIMLSDNPRVREVVESFGGKAQSSKDLYKEMVDKGQMTKQEAGKLTRDSERRSDKKIKRMAGLQGAKEVGKSIGRGIGNEVAGWFEAAAPELFDMFRNMKHNYKGMKATYKYGKEKRMAKIAGKEGRTPTDKATLRAEKLRSQLTDQQRGTSSTARQSPNQSLAKRMKNRQTSTPQPTIKKPETPVRRSTAPSREL
jgi:polyhydroxyalkanoate synthesis regulator phasin